MNSVSGVLLAGMGVAYAWWDCVFFVGQGFVWCYARGSDCEEAAETEGFVDGSSLWNRVSGVTESLPEERKGTTWTQAGIGNREFGEIFV